MTKFWALLVIPSIIKLANCAPAGTDAFLYLAQFGYIERNGQISMGSSDYRVSYSKALQDFQEYAGLKRTGKLNAETLHMMKVPRCGQKDRESKIVKRAIHIGSKWAVNNLTYKIQSYPNTLNRSQVDSEIQKAFEVWSNFSSLNFKPSRNKKAHIEISFVDTYHDDSYPFDGPSGVLAHAYYPIDGGDIHFDSSENWTNDLEGVNLFLVAAHEIGHALGLGHTHISEAMMYPFYKSSFNFDEDDILGIRSLYGDRKKKA